MKKRASNIIDIFLQPGDFYFGDGDTRIRTVLGSCVSITMWHPRLLIGGMCHYMLPNRDGPKSLELNGRYADEAMQLFMKELRAAGTSPKEFQVKLFGAGNMFSNIRTEEENCDGYCSILIANACRSVSCRNRRKARQLTQLNGFNVVAEHLGGEGYRQIQFEIWSGDAWVKHMPSIRAN